MKEFMDYRKLTWAGVGGLAMFAIGRRYAKESVGMQVLGVTLGGVVGYVISDAVLKVKEVS